MPDMPSQRLKKRTKGKPPPAQTWKWRSRVPKDELVSLLADGRSYAAIGRLYDTDHKAIIKLVNMLPPPDLLKIVKARPVVQVPVAQVKHIRAVDLPELMMRVLDTLIANRDFLESPDGENAVPDIGRRMILTYQATDRIMRFSMEFLAMQQKLSEWTGYDLWRDEILQVLEDIQPGLKEKLLQRITSKVFVERGPDAARAAARSLSDPSILPHQVPPSLRAMLSSQEPKPLGSASTDGSSAISEVPAV